MLAPKTNLLIESLSAESRRALLAIAKEVPLPVRTSLQLQEEQPRYAYFLTSGVASVVVNLPEGAAGETSLIGNEGVVGGMALLCESCSSNHMRSGRMC
jgi:CRP-like cAMP-binding protein